jgi:hypothetical protein
MKRPRKMPQKLPAPGARRGRVQRAAKRAALLADERLISTTDVLAVAYARRKLLHGLPLRPHHYRLATRALELVAVRIKRSPTGSGRAWLWRLRHSEEK